MFTRAMAVSFYVLFCIVVSASAYAQVDTAVSWADLLKQSDALNRAKNTDSAFVLAKRAVEVARTANGDKDSSVAMSLHKVSAIAWQKFLPETDSLFKLAIAAWDRVENANQLERAKTLSNYGGRLANTPPYQDAIPILNECLEIRKRLLSPDNIDIAKTEVKLAQAYTNAGIPGEAIPHCDNAIRIFAGDTKATPQQKREPIGIAGMSMAMMGQNDRAVEYFRSALDISLAINDSSWVAMYMSRLASVYANTKRYASADSICIAGLEYLDSENSQSDDRNYWAAVSELHNSRGMALWQSKDLDRAESSLLKSISIKQTKIVGVDKGEILRNQYTLANLYRDGGKTAAAESLYVLVLQQRRELLGKSHRDIAYSLYSLGRLYARQGRYEEAFDSSFAACEMRANIIDDQATVLSESELLNYSNQMREAANQCLSIAAVSEQVQNKRSNQIAELILRTKGFVSDHVFRRELRDQNNIESLTAGLLWSVKKQIPSSTTLLEYFSYAHTEFSDTKPDTVLGNYVVLALSGQAGPVVTFMTPVDQPDSLIGDYQKHLLLISEQGHLPTAAQAQEFTQLTSKIRQLVLAPLQSSLGSTTLLISPDGALNNISFGTLANEYGEFLIETHTIHYLSAGRDILRSSAQHTGAETMVAFADPDFDAPPEQRINRPEQSSIGTALVSGKSKMRSAPNDCLYTRGLKVGKLSGTRPEAEAVCSKWEASTKGKSSRYFGAIASEDNFRTATTRASVVYVATHGFYVDSLCASQSSTGVGEENNRRGSEQLLTQSGFLLSGANRFGKESFDAGVEDGVVSAAEIAEMNFSDSPLVVLSACESALGKIRSGEGVYGLRRAFLLAGARTVLSALWKIDDESTAEMMSQLFSSDSVNLPERIRSLQLAQIEKQRSEKRPVHPYTWGAFMATGDWR